MTLSVPNVFVPGTTAQSGQVNANFAAIVSYVNGLVLPSSPATVPQGGTGSTTAQGALTNLGLSNKTLVNCTATNAGTQINLVQAGDTPTISAYAFGNLLEFFCPTNLTGPITIQLGSLGAKLLYDPPGSVTTASLVANQLCIVAYSSPLAGWVLVNAPPSSGSGYMLKSNNLSDVASTASALTNIGAASVAAFTTGQVLAAPGNQPLSGGLILKWGTATLPASGATTSPITVTFPTAFPSSCYVGLSNAVRAVSVSGGLPSTCVTALSASAMTITGDSLGFANFSQTVGVYWFAIGS
jgi:hypothetical protein